MFSISPAVWNVLRRYQISFLALLALLVAVAVFLPNHLEERALHAMPYGFKKFSLEYPLPACTRWKEHIGGYKQFQDDIRIYQDGVKFGSVDCAAALEVMFRYGYWHSGSDEEKGALMLLGVTADREREKRYSAIYDALKINPDLKLSKLDLVLPLPPAKLPPWSGIEDAVTPESNELPTY